MNTLNHVGTENIETERLVLRRFSYSDSGDMLKNWISDNDIQSLLCEPIYTTNTEINELLSKYIEAYQNKDYYRWVITIKESGECIGQIAFFLMDNNNHFSEIEYCIGKKFQNQGFATECTEALLKYGFERIQLNKIQICHIANNESSKKVIEKCRFTYEGTLRDFFYINGKYVDRLYYSILKKEYTDA